MQRAHGELLRVVYHVLGVHQPVQRRVCVLHGQREVDGVQGVHYVVVLHQTAVEGHLEGHPASAFVLLGHHQDVQRVLN